MFLIPQNQPISNITLLSNYKILFDTFYERLKNILQ